MDSNRASNFPRRGKLLMAEAVKVRDGVDGSHPALEKCACCCERLRLTVEALRQKILRWGHSLFLPAAMPLGFECFKASRKTPSQTPLMGRDEDTKRRGAATDLVARATRVRGRKREVAIGLFSGEREVTGLTQQWEKAATKEFGARAGRFP